MVSRRFGWVVSGLTLYKYRMAANRTAESHLGCSCGWVDCAQEDRPWFTARNRADAHV